MVRYHVQRVSDHRNVEFRFELTCFLFDQGRNLFELMEYIFESTQAGAEMFSYVEVYYDV